MKNLIYCLILMLGISCSTDNDPSPVYVNPVLGTWQIENGGVTVVFDVILVKNSSQPFNPKTDTIFTTNARVTYLGKTGLPPSVDYVSVVSYVNGFYGFSFQNIVGTCPVCVGNRTQLIGFYPNSTFTEMTAREPDPNSINYPYDGSWVSVVGYDGTINQNIIFFKDPIVLKKIKGQY